MMNLHEIINSIGVGLSLLAVLWILAVKITRLEVRVEVIWNFLLKRAIVEGVDKGLMTLNSPVRITNKATSVLGVMTKELQEKYKTTWNKLSENELAFVIEKEYGDRLVQEVCLPNNITLGVCLLIATAIAKGEYSLTEILNVDYSGK